MTTMLFRRVTAFPRLVNNHLLSRASNLSLRFSRVIHSENEAVQNPHEGITSSYSESSLHLSPLFVKFGTQVNDYKIELVDDETWRVSTGLTEAWKGITPALETNASNSKVVGEVKRVELDFDEIEDMRIRGNLFYKLDRDSKEFEEYNFEFHRRKSSKRKGDKPESKLKGNPNSNAASKLETLSKKRIEIKENPSNFGSRGKWLPKTNENEEMEVTCVGKKLRTPTFNQLTAPYHEPFCLDIYISKASVRACVVHRATSKVVAVAHSISKDMKFDLGSTKNVTACAAVGEVLAQRALADDIHNVVYTPRKGEKLEGKLQIVLQSVIRNGVNVKVNIKQRKFRKASFPPSA